VGSAGNIVHSGAFRARNVDTLFFMLGRPVRIPQKCAWTRCTEFMFLHPLGSAGHVVHSGREMSTHSLLCSGGTAMDSTKSVPGHVTPNFFFASDGICRSRSAF
jgi:hypothetical protein